jgi:hypothetical protein
MRRLLLFLAPVVLLVPAPGRGASEPIPEFRVLRAKLRLRTAPESIRHRDSVLLKFWFLESAAPGYDPAEDGISISIGSETLLDVPPVPDRAVTRERPGRFVYRERRTRDRSDVRRLAVDLGANRVKLRASRLDLSGLRAAGPTAVTVRVVLGETVLTEVIDLLEKNDTCWIYKAPHRVRPPEEGIGPIAGPPTKPPDFRPLHVGAYSPLTTPQHLVIRDRASWTKFWEDHREYRMPHQLDLPPPEVDWESEIVVGIFLSERPLNCDHVHAFAVRYVGPRAYVSYEEHLPDECAMGGVGEDGMMQRHYLYAIRTADPVLFTRTVVHEKYIDGIPNH